MDKMEIISLHKRCNKKFSQPKKAPFKSDEPKKHQSHLNLLMIQAKKNRRLKKPMEKRSLQRQEKKLKRPHSQKKHQNHLNLLFIDSSKEEEEDDKEKNTSFTWCEGRSPKFF